MNVACTACPAKYAVPDDKVRGRKVKITCKHCGTALVVDGTKMASDGTGASIVPAAGASIAPKASVVPLTDKASVGPAAKPPQAEAPAAKTAAAPAPEPKPAPKAAPEPAPAPPPEPPAEIEWIVAFTDDRQDPATTAQVVEFYRAGQIDEGTYVWREGMDDWAGPYDIPELRDALRAAGVARKSPPPPPFVGDEDEATRVATSPLLVSGDATTSSSGVWREPGRPAGPEKLPFEEPVALKRQSVKPAAAAESPRAPTAAATARKSERPKAAAKAEAAKPQAARAATKAEPAQRTTAARRRAERAASDDLFGAVAQAGSEQDASLHTENAGADGQRMTGQRNESSVLFSLDALIKTEKSATTGSTTTAKAPSRKRDEEAAILFGEPAPNSIANVGTGGIGMALAAPDFTAPAPPQSAPRSAAVPIEVSAPVATKKKSGVGLIAAILVLGGGAAAAFALGVPQKLMGGSTPATTATAEQPKAATTTEPALAQTAEPAATTAASTAPAASAAPGAAPVAPVAAAGSAPAKPGEPVAAKPPGEAKPGDKPPPKDAPAAPSGDEPPFDKAAASAALGAAAANASSCRQPGGAMGSGRVTVTFAPSGRATGANVSGEVAGTTVGGCVARLFRSVKVPAFSGDPITVGKSFTVE